MEHASAPSPPWASIKLALQRILRPERVIETHAALVFLTATKAIKLKKPIQTRHFDHRTAEARHRTCVAEVEANRALAPGVYLDIWPVTASRTGEAELDGDGDPIDWVIVMQRLPADALLDELIRSGAPIDWTALDQLFLDLFRFYRASPEPPAGRATYLKTLRAEAELSTSHLVTWRDRLGPDVAELCRHVRERLDAVSEEIMKREREGCVVDGHGDLRPEHVCLQPPVILDRIEFSADYRLIDAHDEIGYLGLEAEILGNAEIGVRLRHLLIENGFAAPSEALADTFRITRCLIRARLCIDHLLDAHPRTPEVWPQKASRYLDEIRASRDA